MFSEAGGLLLADAVRPQVICRVSAMLMVIFGAGASFDSCPTYPSETGGEHRPPLANELFANRTLFIDAVEEFPQCKTIVPRLRDPAVTSGEKSIEILLQEIGEEAKTYARGLQELAAVRCYLQRAISQCEKHWLATTKGITNYLTLLREIERTHVGDDPVCLATFNYDTLLEAALRELGLGITRMEDYTQRLVLFRVFKLHGSVNWAQEVEIQLPANVNRNDRRSVLRYLIEHAAQLQISNRFVLCDPASMGVTEGRIVFPAIAIPVEKKGTFQCPQHMIDELIAALPHVTKILVIGWRATEAHFLALLKEHLKPMVQLYTVAGHQREAAKINTHIQAALAGKLPDSFADPDNSGFSQFMLSGRATQFLNR